jgi:hypothetical protein
LQALPSEIKLNNLTAAFIAATANSSPMKRQETSAERSHIASLSSEVDQTGEIDFPTFFSVLMECGLAELANRHVFNIFGMRTNE